MQIARQAAAFERLQPQALLAWLAMGDEIWIQCKPEPQALSVRQIQDLVLAKFLSARLEFRAPTNGHTTQVADLIVLEYETLAARHLCSGEYSLVVRSILGFEGISPCSTSFHSLAWDHVATHVHLHALQQVQFKSVCCCHRCQAMQFCIEHHCALLRADLIPCRVPCETERMLGAGLLA